MLTVSGKTFASARGLAQSIWMMFLHSSVWRALRRVAVFRSGVYLSIELWRWSSKAKELNKEAIDRDFRLNDDPFRYMTTLSERLRFDQQAKLLDYIRKGGCFHRALEIGCAQGVFTEMLAERCKSLVVLDISPTALAKTRKRRTWGSSLHFQEWDLKHDSVPGTFDLIVAAGVLEYLQELRMFRKVRAKLVAALRTGGYLLLQSTRVNPVVENAWWAKYIIRGSRINRFFCEDKELQAIEWIVTENYAVTLFRKPQRP